MKEYKNYFLMYKKQDEGKYEVAVIPASFQINIYKTDDNNILVVFCNEEGIEQISCDVYVQKENRSFLEANYDDIGMEAMVIRETLDWLIGDMEQCTYVKKQPINLERVGDYLAIQVNGLIERMTTNTKS